MAEEAHAGDGPARVGRMRGGRGGCGGLESAGGDLAFSALAFALALLPRLYVAIAWAREPVWDGHYYDFGARRIAAGLGYSDDLIVGGQAVWHPWCHYPVGYSGFLGLVYKLFGAGPHVATVANAVVGALLVVVVHRLAWYATTPARARVAALLAALSPGLILYAALVMTEPLAALGLVTAPWLLARDAARGRLVRGALLAGAALGLTALVRPQSLLCAPALALLAMRGPAGVASGGAAATASAGGAAATAAGGAAAITSGRAAAWKRGALAAALAAATALAVVAPWTIRNCRVMDGCALVSTNGGWNLAIGAFPRATGRFETLRAGDGCPIARGQVAQDRCWMAAGLQWIKNDPGRWLALIPKKLGFTFDHESFPIGYLGEADPAAWPEERRAAGRRVLTASHLGLLSAAALGVVAMPRRRPRRELVAQLLALAAVLGLIAWGVLGDGHAFWPLAVAIPLIAALPLPGRPANGGVVGYLAFAVASVALTHAVFFGEDRYHMVVTPALCILAACALRRGETAGAADRADAQEA
ncbi:glycosyltransferase family 39 protein [Sorangium sp. So ce1000]|uniref:glycosyltransferase family 39 protein n=1 Tax=Sorangium sp. So ce1000 TaxID=3133325 RepID=UPI003F644931